MGFDPFALVTSPVEISPPNTPPPAYKEEVPSIFPSKIPTTDKKDLSGLLDAAFAQARVNEIKNGPLYLYKTKDETRYSNPYLQFDPAVLGGYDIEDIYGKFQGTGESLWNALIKTGATIGSSFISNFTSFGNSIDSIRSGKLFDPDSVLGQTQGWLHELEDKYPNYYTQWEREHPFISAIPFSGGATNFWGDKIIKNAGFTIGSLASAAVVDTGIELATGGSATPATLVLAAKQLQRAFGPMKTAFRNLTKMSVTRNVDDFVGLTRVAGGINNGLKAGASAYDLKKGLQFAAITYFSAQGEGMIEGYQNYYQTKSDLVKQANDQGKLKEKLPEIEKVAQKAGQVTTALNIPIIAASNIIQFSNVLGGRNVVKMFDSPFLNIVNKEGLTLVNNYSRKKAVAGVLKETGKDFVSEGFEEGYQYYIGNAFHDYYVDQFNGESKRGMLAFLSNQIPKTLQDQQFWENFYVGGLTGGLMGILHNTRKFSNSQTDEVIKRLQPVLDRFNTSVKDLTHLAENVEFSSDQNELNQFYSAHKALFSTVHDSLKYGTYENYLSALEDLRQLPYEEYNKLFQTEYTNDVEKNIALTSLINESNQIAEEVTNTAKFFNKNPFVDNYTTQRIKDIFKVNDLEVKPIQQQLFNQYKELVAYNVSRLRNVNEWVVDAEENLKMQGLDKTILPVLRILGTDKAKGEYLKLKRLQLKSLQEELAYQQELENEPEIITLKQKVKKLENLVPAIEKVDNEELLYRLIFNEEMGKEQLISEERFLREAEELRHAAQVKENVEKDLEDQVAEPEEAAKEQIEVIDKLKPEPKKRKDLSFYNTFVKEFGILEPGDKFQVSTLEGEKIYTVTNQRGGALDAIDNEGNSYVFSGDPDQPVLKNPNSDRQSVYQYASTYKVRKVEEDQITPFVERIKSGEKLDSPEDLQFYENNKQEIESRLKQEKSKKKPVRKKSEELFEQVEKDKDKAEEPSKVNIEELLEKKEEPEKAFLPEPVEEGPREMTLEEIFPEGKVNIETLLKSNIDQFISEEGLLKEVIGWQLNKGIIIEC